MRSGLFVDFESYSTVTFWPCVVGHQLRLLTLTCTFKARFCSRFKARLQGQTALFAYCMLILPCSAPRDDSICESFFTVKASIYDGGHVPPFCFYFVSSPSLLPPHTHTYFLWPEGKESCNHKPTCWLWKMTSIAVVNRIIEWHKILIEIPKWKHWEQHKGKERIFTPDSPLPPNPFQNQPLWGHVHAVASKGTILQF